MLGGGRLTLNYFNVVNETSATAENGTRLEYSVAEPVIFTIGCPSLTDAVNSASLFSRYLIGSCRPPLELFSFAFLVAILLK